MIKASVPLKTGMSYTHLKCERIKVPEGTVMRMSEKYLDKCLELMGLEPHIDENTGKVLNAALTPLVESSWDESDSPLVSEEMQKKCMMDVCSTSRSSRVTFTTPSWRSDAESGKSQRRRWQ